MIFYELGAWQAVRNNHWKMTKCETCTIHFDMLDLFLNVNDAISISLLKNVSSLFLITISRYTGWADHLPTY